MDKSKRVALQAGAAVLAALGGGYYGWQKFQPDTRVKRVPDAVWLLVFPDLAGKSTALNRYRGRPVLLNFWATWCPPCVAEMPLLNDFYIRNHGKGIQVLGIAVDQQVAVQAFVREKNIQFPILLAGAGGIGLSRTLGNQARALPFSVWIQPEGTVGFLKMGELSAEDIKKIDDAII